MYHHQQFDVSVKKQHTSTTVDCGETVTTLKSSAITGGQERNHWQPHCPSLESDGTTAHKCYNAYF
jgi:hypothetical protein